MNRLYHGVANWSWAMRDFVFHALGRQFVPNSFTKFLIIDRLRRDTGASAFIESGTFHGVTARRCASAFARVWTIELDRDLATRATQSLSDLANIRVLQGDVLERLPDIFDDPAATDAIVYLDGHFSGDGTARGSQAEPAVEALSVLARYLGRIKAVIIDDFRTFGVEPGFPLKSELLASIERHFPEDQYDWTLDWDQVHLVRRRAPRGTRR